MNWLKRFSLGDYLTHHVVASYKSPEIVTCRMGISNTAGEAKNTTSGNPNTCKNERFTYFNFQPNTIHFTMESEFTVRIDRPKPNHIEDFNFGVVQHSVTLKRISITNNIDVISPSIVMNNTTICNTNFNDDEPATKLVSCQAQVSTPSIQNGEKLCLEFTSFGGGFLRTRDFANIISSKKSYKRTRSSQTVCFRYDDNPPVHCSIISSCYIEPLSVDRRITTESSVEINFSGWFDLSQTQSQPDQASGIEHFSLTLFGVHELDHQTLEMKGPLNSSTIPANTSRYNLKLPKEPSLYAILLEVHDIAGNVKGTRRFVLYDNSSSVQIDHGHILRVTSAYEKTNYTWQVNHGSICLEWTGRYYNSYHKENNLLRNIRSDASVSPEYDQIHGHLPISGTPNVDGIVEFYYQWKLKGSVLPLTLKKVTNVKDQSFCENFKLSDGETYTFLIKPIDINNRSINENITVHIDSSRPEIDNIWLTKDGYKQLYVHYSSDLSKMVLEFEAMDAHSGLRSIEWKLGTASGLNNIGSGAISVNRSPNETVCSTTSCYCPMVGLCENYMYTLTLNKLVAIGTHEGQHNRNYFFAVIATNNARLTSVERVDILADESPPLTGTIQEGPGSGPDIDFTSDDVVIVHWDGFIDHESGVKLYRVAVATRCLEQVEFDKKKISNNATFANIKEVFDNEALFTVTSPGRYFSSMVAYNNAMEPSRVVCSDGFAKDVSSPDLTDIFVKKVKAMELIACDKENVYLIREDMVKVRLMRTSVCEERCRALHAFPYLKALPVENSKSNDTSIADDLCQRLPGFSDDWYIYLPSDKIHMQCNPVDKESQIRFVQIGFSSDSSEIAAPDIEDFAEMHIHSEYINNHAGIDTGLPFYMILKVRNKANLETVVPYGPIVIDETPPVYKGDLQLHLDQDNVYCWWKNGTFYDSEQRHPVNVVLYKIGAGDKFYTPILEKDSAKDCFIPEASFCVQYSIKRLKMYNVEKDLDFFFELYVYNMAGHCTTVRSETFTVPSMYPPGKGIVVDTYSLHEKNVLDIDFVRHGFNVCAIWTGFHHRSNMQFEAGLGEIPNTDSKISYALVNDTSSGICFQTSDLEDFKKYYTTIRVNSTMWSTVFSSDGFIVVNETFVLDTVNISIGDTCLDQRNATITCHTSPQNCTSVCQIICDQGFKEKEVYSILHVNSSMSDLRIKSSDLLWIASNILDGMSFRSLSESPEMYVEVGMNKSSPLELTFAPCLPYKRFLHSTDVINIHWSIEPNYDDFISHYVIYLYHIYDDTEQGSFPSKEQISSAITKGKTHQYQFNKMQLLDNTKYRIGLKACFEDVCLPEVFSSEAIVQGKPPLTGLDRAEIITTNTSCLKVILSWQHFECIGINGEQDICCNVAYRWTLAMSIKASSAIIPWQKQDSIKCNANNLTVEACVKIPVYPHRSLFACVRGICKSGVESTVCTPVETPSPNLYKEVVVYDLNAKNPNFEAVKSLLHSRYLGDKLADIHSFEIDFCRQRDRIAAAIVSAGERTVTWFLMMQKGKIPNGACEDEKLCVMSKTTLSGYVEFFGAQLLEDNVYYVCAVSNKTVISREMFDETLEELSICSNGVYVDETPPIIGNVFIENQRNGFLHWNKTIEISWSGFLDRSVSEMYGTDVKYYSYAIGTTPGGQEILPYTNVGYSNSVIHECTNLNNGASYFASVKATDYVGLYSVAVSSGVTLDISPPSKGVITVGSVRNHKNIVSSKAVRVYWEGFADQESGILDLLVGVGSKPGRDDIVSFRSAPDQYMGILNDADFRDGELYYATAHNRAGLVREAVSDAFLVDSSPPEGGVVRDGSINQTADLNYDTETRRISCHWSDFQDPHSGIAYYKVGLGTQRGSINIAPLVDVRLRKEHTWKGVFTPGVKYFVTVEACNGAGLCTKRYSNGIILDNSPPVPGLVHVGLSDKHETFQSHRHSLTAKWIGFHDPQSDLHYFEYCLTTNISEKNTCDLINWTNCLLANEIFRSGLDIPEHKLVYVKVRSVNNAGLVASGISAPFQIDTTPPEVMEKPKFVLSGMQVSHREGTQWENSLLRLQWKFSDEESRVTRHVVKLVTHRDGLVEQERIEITNEEKLTIQFKNDSRLRNGDRYIAYVTACNGAGLCTNSSTETLLIDSSPPHLGGFKPPMSWENTSNGTRINLTWFGFKDIESSIDIYFLQISRTYSGNELSNGVITVQAKDSDIQNISVLINGTIRTGNDVILSIWAANGVGLRSPIGRVTVTALSTDSYGSTGILKLQKHSCVSHYCNNDCTCAAIGKYCQDTVNYTTCLNENISSSANDILNITVLGGMEQEHQKLSASSTCLSCHWVVLHNGSLDILRYEWSIGLLAGNPGDGIFEGPSERRWEDVGKETQVTYCLPYPRQLIDDEDYVFYVKAWFSNTLSTVFKSPPIKIDTSAPTILRGKYVIESLDNCKTDAEFITNLTSVSICWENIFQDSQSGIIRYELMAGTSPYGDDLFNIADVNLSTRFDFHDLYLLPGVRYYFTVRATNKVGLMTSLASDGIVYDNEPPFDGQVFNTDKFRNVEYQLSTSELGISWNGFGDYHSFIKKYIVNIIDMTLNEIILSHFDVGIQNTINIRNLNLIHGHRYSATVHAIDAAGYSSNSVRSTILTVDSSKPEGFHCNTFSRVGNTTSFTSNYSMNLTRDKFYHLKISSVVYPKFGKLALSIGRHEMLLHLAKNHNGSFETELNFMSPYTGETPLTLYTEDGNANGAMQIQLSECINMTLSPTFSPMDLKQIGPDLISICLKILDPESGVKTVLVGAGTTKNGFQIQPLSPMPTENHIILPVDVRHGSPVYITAITWNHAGSQSIFTSDPIIIDHTAPVITNVTASVKAKTENSSDGVDILVTWSTKDIESAVKLCYCGLGEDMGSVSFVPLTLSSSTERCRFSTVSVAHGTTLYPHITCVNNVELASSTCGKGFVVSYLHPSIEDAKAIFMPQNRIQMSAGSGFQSNLTLLVAQWQGFTDVSGINNYQCKLLKDGHAILEDINTGKHSGWKSYKLPLQDDSTYRLEIIAVNAGNIHSEPITCNISTYSKSPLLTGNAAKITQLENEVYISWHEVFDLDKQLKTTFYVRMGSAEGHADLVHWKSIQSKEMSINKAKVKDSIWIYLRAIYDTGESTIYRNILLL
ncbi:hypothetical protein CHS0354_017089 [Potamilus streckersoni]|uniref:Fibronectin type-III domain-containing protein n=1 Tax=Potamilus streckersoni TaxID=2493646 RepID=A0AAE0VSL3_9BIVA|nr:hypothetical protein CHS0354_017089 [Potamilus streckersoni]